MADEHHLFQIERFDECREIVGVGIHVVAVPGLAGSAMTATVMSDRAIAMGGYEEHLVVPGVRVERPPVTEDDRMPRAPVLVIDFSGVLRGDCSCIHGVRFSSHQD